MDTATVLVTRRQGPRRVKGTWDFLPRVHGAVIRQSYDGSLRSMVSGRGKYVGTSHSSLTYGDMETCPRAKKTCYVSVEASIEADGNQSPLLITTSWVSLSDLGCQPGRSR